MRSSGKRILLGSKCTSLQKNRDRRLKRLGYIVQIKERKGVKVESFPLPSVSSSKVFGNLVQAVSFLAVKCLIADSSCKK